jgi:murein DD-endopeptidase MepM/ murein hydrolase activator NlpD
MRLHKLLIILSLLTFQNACQTTKNPNKEIPAFLLVFPADSFAYPIGKTDFATEDRDWDAWYNAQDFGENRHLGEDWNANTGGDTDCGAPVYAAGDGRIAFAEDAGAGWGNVIIIEHTAPNGMKIQSLYGHLESIAKTTSVEVKKREQIGTVGSANGRYKCHLHFEIRSMQCPLWNKPGGGYGDDKNGWIDPSEFINKTRGSAF